MYVAIDLAPSVIAVGGVIAGALIVGVGAWYGEKRAWTRTQRLHAYSELLDAARHVMHILEGWHHGRVDVNDARDGLDSENDVFSAVAKVELLGSARVFEAGNNLNEHVMENVWELLHDEARLMESRKLRTKDVPEAARLLLLLNEFIIEARHDLGQRRWKLRRYLRAYTNRLQA